MEAIAGCPRAIKDLTEALMPTLVEQFSGSRRLIGRSGDDSGHGSNRSGVHDDYDDDSHSDGVGPQRARGNGGSEISSGNGSGDEAGQLYGPESDTGIRMRPGKAARPGRVASGMEI